MTRKICEQQELPGELRRIKQFCVAIQLQKFDNLEKMIA
jgi:hypothetical protein